MLLSYPSVNEPSPTQVRLQNCYPTELQNPTVVQGIGTIFATDIGLLHPLTPSNPCILNASGWRCPHSRPATKIILLEFLL